jgi:S1-C subfamily serine protease
METIERASQATVSVFGPTGSGGGSAVVISPDGYALSNFHVVKPSGDHMKCSLPNGNLYDAVVVGIDPTGDVALIRLLGSDQFPHAPMGDSDQLRVGQWCFAVGNPFLLATDLRPTVTYGIISGVHRYQYPSGTLLEYTDCIQTDASINPGNSGGPLFNDQGQLVGINGRGSFEKRGRVNVGVAYAISINQIKNFLGHLHSGRLVDHATLGATVSSDEEGRVIVVNILESSDAYRRGLRVDDEIVAFGGRPIQSVNSFKNVLGIFPRGWRVPMSFRRDGERFDRLVRLAGVHSPEELINKVQQAPLAPPEPKPPPEPGPRPLPRPPQPPRGEEPPMPEHVAKFYIERRGYANYYFNQLHRDRVWKTFSDHGVFSELVGPWSLQGELADGQAVQIHLTEQEALIELPNGQSRVDLTKDLDDQLVPQGSGGLLVALAMWRRLLVRGPDKFGEVYYLGTVPAAGRLELLDALVATYDVMETHFLFDPSSGQLLGMDMFPDSHVDPCEVTFGDFRSVDGRELPHRLVVRHGGSDVAQIELHRYSLATQSGSPM